jgi:hypothetical protein
MNPLPPPPPFVLQGPNRRARPSYVTAPTLPASAAGPRWEDDAPDTERTPDSEVPTAPGAMLPSLPRRVLLLVEE